MREVLWETAYTGAVSEVRYTPGKTSGVEVVVRGEVCLVQFVEGTSVFVRGHQATTPGELNELLGDRPHDVTLYPLRERNGAALRADFRRTN